MTTAPIQIENASGLSEAHQLLTAHLGRSRSPRDPVVARRDRHETTEAAALALLRDLWVCGAAEFFVLSPSMIRHQIDYEVDAELTPEEQDQIVDAVMNDPWFDQALGSLHTAFNALVGVHAKRVLERGL